MIYATNISRPDSRMRGFSRVRDFTAVVVLVHVVTFFSVLFWRFWSFFGCKASKDNSTADCIRALPVAICTQGPQGPFSRAYDMRTHTWAQAHYLTITVPIDTI